MFFPNVQKANSIAFIETIFLATILSVRLSSWLLLHPCYNFPILYCFNSCGGWTFGKGKSVSRSVRGGRPIPWPQSQSYKQNWTLGSKAAPTFLQGLSERMSKVKSLWKSQFLQKIIFLSCFRSEISGKFVPYYIQVHHNHPKSSLEVGASIVLSYSSRLLEADHWPWDSEQRPPPCFWDNKDKI